MLGVLALAVLLPFAIWAYSKVVDTPLERIRDATTCEQLHAEVRDIESNVNEATADGDQYEASQLLDYQLAAIEKMQSLGCE